MGNFGGGVRFLKPGYATAFPANENPISEGSHWTNGDHPGVDWTDMRTLSGKCFGTETGSDASIYDDSTGILTGIWSSDQVAGGKIFTTRSAANWNSEVEMRLRSVVSAGVNRGYEFNVRIPGFGTPYVEIIRWNGGIGDFKQLVHTDNANFATATGDHLRATAIGSVLSSYLTIAGVDLGNGVGKEALVATYNTSTGNDGGTGGNPGGADSIVWTDGNPGLGTFAHDFGATSDITTYGFTYFYAYNV